jgi:hypothetical protein
LWLKKGSFASGEDDGEVVLYVIKFHALKTHRRAVDGGEWSASRPGIFIPAKDHPMPVG